MNDYLKNLEIKYIDISKVDCLKEYCLIYSKEAYGMFPSLFYFHDDRYYSVFFYEKIAKLRKNNTNPLAIVSNDRKAIVEFIISFRGLESLGLMERLSILKFLEKEEFDTTQLGNIRKYLPLLDLPYKALIMLNENRLSPELGLKLCKYEKKEIDTFISAAENLKLNINLQKELFDYIVYKIHRENKTFLEIINTILEDAKNHNKEALFSKIRRNTMPSYMATLELFTQFKKYLTLPKKINLVESPFFETKSLKIELHFKSFEELIEHVNALQNNLLTKKEAWKKIFQII